MGFVRNTVPYILSVRDYFNSSIQGNGIYYGLPSWLILLLRVIFLALAVAVCGCSTGTTGSATSCSGWSPRPACC